MDRTDTDLNIKTFLSRGLGASSLSYSQRRRIFKATVTAFIVIYSLVTLFPFYVLFVRTFVSSKDAGDLYLWIPPQRDVTLDAGIGNLAVQYNLDIKQVKQDLGIKGYVNPQTTLRELGVEFNIPAEKIQEYFRGYGTYNGWINLLLKGPRYWYALLRTLLITLLSLVGMIVLGIMTGYGLSGLRRRDQMFVYSLYLLQMVIPAMLIIIPQFLIVKTIMNLLPGADQPGTSRYISQIVSIVLINIKGGALTTLIFTTAITLIPREIEESAQIDGASRMQYLTHILLPLMKTAIATVIVIQLPAIWNQFLEGFVYLDPDNTTVLVLIREIGGQYAVNYQMVYTGVLVSIVPLLVVYLVFRRFFISGAMAGAVKG